MRNKANWQAGRTVRDGSLGYISLVVENEDLGSVADDTWVSPTTAVQVGESEGFVYSGGQIVWDRPYTVLARMHNFQALTLAGGSSASVEGTGGLDNTPCEDFSMYGSSALGGEAVAINECRFIMSQGDTLDAYVKHHEGSAKDVTMVKGVYHVDVIEIVS